MGYPGVTDATACAFAENRAFVEHSGRSEPLCTAYHTDNKNGRGIPGPRDTSPMQGCRGGQRRPADDIRTLGKDEDLP